MSSFPSDLRRLLTTRHAVGQLLHFFSEGLRSTSATEKITPRMFGVVAHPKSITYADMASF